jgi:hypothetical protein
MDAATVAADQPLVQPVRKRRPLYAIGKHDEFGTTWLGLVKGAQHALQATQIAQRALGDPDVSACPWKALAPEQRRTARTGALVEVDG